MSRELGKFQIEPLFSTQESHVEIKDSIDCPAKPQFTIDGPNWRATVLSVPGVWLYDLFAKYGDSLFSVNYRGFLGINRRRRVNILIKQSAETRPTDFWVFNNGITVLTLSKKSIRDGIRLSGISIINGAQTTGSIGTVDLNKSDLKSVQVLCRIIECSDRP